MGLMTFLRNQLVVARYKRLRDVGKGLNTTLVGRLPKHAMLECAKKLGIRKGKRVILGSVDAMDILVDYSLYSFRRAGKTVIQGYLENSPPPNECDEMFILRAMLGSHYSLFMVKQVHKGVGVTLFDIIRNRIFLLVDIGFGLSAVPGTFFAGRVIPIGRFFMTSGCFLPLARELMKDRIIPIMEKFLLKVPAECEYVFSPTQEDAFSGQIIRAALRSGALDSMVYRDHRA